LGQSDCKMSRRPREKQPTRVFDSDSGLNVQRSTFDYHDSTMNNWTPVTRPVQSQVTIDPIAKDCPSEGFNVRQHFLPFLYSWPDLYSQYPTFPQLNKQARVQLSQPLNPDPSTSYRLFATANIKEWFVAVVAGSSSSSGITAPSSTFELDLQKWHRTHLLSA